LDAADYWGHDKTDGSIDDENDDAFQDEEKNMYGDDYGVNIAAEKSTVEKTGGAFGKQKHNSTVVATCEIRKQILAQHFNVVQTA
jgi:hypothetical protein